MALRLFNPTTPPEPPAGPKTVRWRINGQAVAVELWTRGDLLSAPADRIPADFVEALPGVFLALRAV